MVVNTIKSCDIDLRRELAQNVITAGGTTMVKNFSERLHKSISKIFPKELQVKLTAPSNRKYSCWIGGATLASL